MSKYLGKLLLEAKLVKKPRVVFAKYVKSRGAYCFKVDRNPEFYVKDWFCVQLARIKGDLSFQYKWSVGYVVQEKRGIEELSALRNEELNMFGGRKELMLSGAIDSDDDFDMLCVIQYLFVFNPTILIQVKRWNKKTNSLMELKLRELGNRGRKRGSKNINKSFELENVETLDETVLRCNHNMFVAVRKGYYLWYEEAYKEKCKAQGVDFDKEHCKELWEEARLKVE